MLDVCVPWETVKSMMKVRMVLVHPRSSPPTLGKILGMLRGKPLDVPYLYELEVFLTKNAKNTREIQKKTEE